MSYTSTDLAAVKSARVELATGKRVVRVTIAGKSAEYAETDDDKLRQLENDILQQLNVAAKKPRFIRISSSKGL